LAGLIRAEIAAQGPMPFSRYMERCLYAPGLGYYSAGRTKFGAAGDFVTAPELGSLFAQTVADALMPSLDAQGPQADFVELGGGSGAFAEAAMAAFSDAGKLPCRYRILEPSADLRERQRERLQSAFPQAVFDRFEWLDRPPEESWRGVLFANEVIDALPTTRFCLHEGEVYEEHVIADEAGVLEYRDRPADALTSAAVRHVERDLGRPFVDGYRSEILPQLPYWMQAVLGSLESGLVLLIDYGYPRETFYLPERSDGTLVCHYRHRAHADALILPGLQDITAFVDFTALAEAGNQAGFAVAGFASQGQFLIASGLASRFEQASAGADQVACYRLAQEVKRLTLPGEMGEKFNIMLLARDLPETALPPGIAHINQGFRL
jgi:SAM-dependent MidA family methyltransferase